MRHFSLIFAALLGGLFVVNICIAQPVPNRKFNQEDKFRQLEEILPTPNGYRSAAGEPGPEYWQQEADYVIDVKLDDEKHTITGRETITYKNRSPHTLKYVWLQLDANIFKPDSDSNKMRQASFGPLNAEEAATTRRRGQVGGDAQGMSVEALNVLAAREAFDGGCNITEVTDYNGAKLAHVIVKTMMRVDLPTPLAPNSEFVFNIGWNYNINDFRIAPGRTGFEYFERDKNCIYEIAQWFPRMVAYTDATGWQHKQYLGAGEFTLELGDYLVRITVPSDHVVAATGVLQNPNEVLSEAQRQRLAEAKTAPRPMFVVTPDEAKEAEKTKATTNKTWVFHAKKVRDFAFASSRKFIWDAQGHNVEGNHVMAMSLYPIEGEPLWSKYSTHSIIHTLNVYSRYTFAYPYPVAWSINGPVGGMEYPMICFNGPRPEKDGTYTAATKYGLISVVIHEVGHNYFPMIVNSDERQWTWMDEGLNTFLQYLSEQEWEKGYPSQRGEPRDITGYMQSTYQVPIMTNSESLMQFGPNAYSKPATALNILRETILGRELFDFAFREYAQRWKFKRPNPADFFRTMEDASGVDLDWFWRGWFYTTDHVDIAIEGVDSYMIDNGDPDALVDRKKKAKAEAEKTFSEERNEPLVKRADEYPELKDFYNSYDPDASTEEKRAAFKRFMDSLTPEEKALVEAKTQFYRVRLSNIGGLVMPVIIRATFQDNSEKDYRIPAEIWRLNSEKCSMQIIADKPIKSIELDPKLETADVDRNNNHFPAKIEPTRFRVFKANRGTFGVGGAPAGPQGPPNPMQQEKAREAMRARRSQSSGATPAPGATPPGATPPATNGQPMPEKKPETKPEEKPETKPEPKPETKPDAPKAEEKPAAPANPAAPPPGSEPAPPTPPATPAAPRTP